MPKKLEEFDLVVLGSGTGAKVAAWTTAQQGERVALIERKYIGGSCHNIACLPSKNIIHSAKVASYVRRAKEFGIAIDGFRIDMSAVRERKRKMVSHSVDFHIDMFKRTGVELILGSGRFIGPRTLEVTQQDGTSRQVHADKVIISTGTRATIDSTPGLAEAQPLTHIEALELGEIPQHLIVIGGGYVGLELSQAMRRFGSSVSVVDRNNRLLHREDEDVSEGLRRLFVDEGIDLVMNARVKSVSGKSGHAVRVVIEQNGVEHLLERRRDHGLGSDRNNCGATLDGAPRSHSDSPDTYRGTQLPVCGRADVRNSAEEKNRVVGVVSALNRSKA
jgi:pyruvate/2-oxoglutarate dehydrogenase complex dihydrolipoamide dehydrogenase (E3) component